MRAGQTGEVAELQAAAQQRVVMLTATRVMLAEMAVVQDVPDPGVAVVGEGIRCPLLQRLQKRD